MPDKPVELEKIKRIISCIENERPIFQKKWKLQERGYAYLGSDQYTADEKAYFNNQKRPANVFNLIFERWNHILGDHFLNDQRQRVYHKAGGTPQVAQTWEDILNHYHDINNYRMEIGKTVLAGWIGCGCLYQRWSDERDIDGGIVYTNIDEFDVMWDSRCRDYFLDDAEYVIRHRWMSYDQILKEWPQHRRRLEDLRRDDENGDTEREEWRKSASANAFFADKKSGKYRIIEFHEIPYEDTEIVYDPVTGEANVFAIGDDRRRALFFKANPGFQLINRKAKVKYITTVIPALQFILDKKRSTNQDGTYDIIPYHPYPYGRFAVDNYGLMKVVIEPQDFLNDMMNRALDVMNRNANAGAEIIREAYENPEAATKFGATPGVTLFKKKEWADNPNTYKRFDAGVVDMAAYTVAQDARYFIESVTNTTENLIGRKESASEPASLYAQRVAQAQVKFAVPSYCLNSVKKRLNEKMLYCGQSNIPSNKMFLITDQKTGSSRELYVNLQMGDQVMNDLNAGEYQVTIDIANMNPTAMLVRNERKQDIVDRLAALLGPMAAQAIDWEWYLGDTDLGDMTKQIEKINQVLGVAAQAQGDQQALATGNAILDTAAKQVQMLDTPPEDVQQTSGNPAESSPA